METKEVFEKTGKLGNEVTRLRRELEFVNMQCLLIMEKCPHEIVFKYNDNHARKVAIDGNYFCPSCGKTVTCLLPDRITDSVFKNSRIIPLNHLSIVRSSDLYYTMRNEVYSNFDYYYNKEVSVDELANKMESLLKEKDFISYDDSQILMMKYRN